MGSRLKQSDHGGRTRPARVSAWINGRIGAYRRLCAVYLLSLMSGAMSVPSLAGEARSDDISSQLATLRGETDRAVLYIGPRPGSFSFVHRRNEADLPQIGCTYEIGRDEIDELLDILVKGQITRGAKQDVDARTGVYLYAGSRQLAKLVFADAFINEGMRGIFNGDMPVMSGLKLQSDLREFAERHTPSSTHYGCEKGGRIAPAPPNN